jgi:hypothetical protein
MKNTLTIRQMFEKAQLAFDPSYIQYLLYIAGARAKHPMDVDIDTCVSMNMVQLSAHDNILLFVDCDRMCDYYVDPNTKVTMDNFNPFHYDNKIITIVDGTH